jgi:hypothetical protein
VFNDEHKNIVNDIVGDTTVSSMDEGYLELARYLIHGIDFDSLLETIMLSESRQEALEILKSKLPRSDSLKSFAKYLDVPWAGSILKTQEAIIDATWQAKINSRVISDN